MENTRKFNSGPATLARSAVFIDRVHPCADCPIRLLAVKRPGSIFALIHAWHMTWWPGWKAHQARTCAFAARAGAQAQSKP